MWCRRDARRTHILSRRTWLVGVVVLIAAAATARIVALSARPSQPSAAATGAAVQFGTLPPGAKLPSGMQCARRVRGSPSPENRPVNKTFNDTAGQHVGPGFSVGDSPQVQALATRISGAFTGTTEEILRWAACKWGIARNIVFAQAAVESWWQQDELGDWGTQAGRCPPGHGRGATADLAGPESYGILQDKYPLEQPGWPGIGNRRR